MVAMFERGRNKMAAAASGLPMAPPKRLSVAGRGESIIFDVESDTGDAWLAHLNAELEKHCGKAAAAARQLAALQERTLQICDDLHRELSESRRIVRSIAHAAKRSNVQNLAAKSVDPKDAPAEHGLPAARLKRVLTYIDASLDEPLTVVILAGVAGMSPSHFAALFKRSTGLSPHEAVLRRRVGRATELLCEDHSIAAIGCQLGFSSQAHFTTAFRKRVGLTPRAFRLASAISGKGSIARKISADPAIRPPESESPPRVDAPKSTGSRVSSSTSWTVASSAGASQRPGAA